MSKEKIERKIVIPGEVIAKGNDYLPGEGTEKKGEEIIARKYGLAEESNRLVKVISLSGVYQPRRGNVVIGKVESINFNGWVADIDTADRTFLSVQEVPRYVNRDGLTEVLDVGDVFVSKIVGISGRGIDLTLKGRGFGRIEGGMIIEVNPNKVPRIIGKEGSMINLIKNESGCNITVGQNGLIWVKGNKIEDELLVRKAIAFIEKKSFSSGLTDEVKEWFNKEKGNRPNAVDLKEEKK